MAQIILVSEEKSFARTMQKRIIQKYGLECVIFQDEAQAISMISLLPDIQIIISSSNCHKKICDYFAKNSDVEKIKVMVIGNKVSSYELASAVPINFSVDNLVHQVGYLLNLEEGPAQQSAPIIEETATEVEAKTTVFVMPKLNPAPVVEEKPIEPEIEYAPISMKFFMHLNSIEVDFDIYARVKKGDTFDYNLKISAGAKLSESDFERIKVRGGKELFVKKESLGRAQEFFGTNFVNRFKNPGISLNDRMILNSESYEILLDVFKDSSFTKYSIEIIKEMIKSFNVLLNSPEPLQAFFTGLKQKELSYGYMHSYLSCLMLIKIVDNFPWKKDQSLNKIVYLALFHDLCLHNSRLIKIHHNYFAEVDKLTDGEKQILHVHADAAAKILENIVKAPKELTTIVREHHGLKLGNGFLEDLSLGIGPLSMAFIVVEEFVTKYLEFWEASNKDIVSEFLKNYPHAIFESLSKKYNKLTYQEVVQALEKLIKV